MTARRADPKVNPHCAAQWPHDTVGSHRLAIGMEACSGALAIARLLHADTLIGEVDEGIAPYSVNTRAGLESALLVCLNTTMRTLEDAAEGGQHADP